MPYLPKSSLASLTGVVNERYAALRRALPSSTCTFILGFVHGMADTFEEADEHLRALDALCDGLAQTSAYNELKRKASLGVLAYLAHHGATKPKRAQVQAART